MIVREVIQETAKKYNLHQLDCMDFWYKRDDMLFMAKEVRNIGYSTWTISFKPLYTDELVYQILEAGGMPNAKYLWEQFKKKASLMRIRAAVTGPAKKIYGSRCDLPSTEDDCRKFYEKHFEEFLEMTKDIKESDYATDAELTMINILAAIHRKDYKRAMKLTNKISSLGNVFPWVKNARPEEEILWGGDYLTWKKRIKKYIESVNG